MKNYLPLLLVLGLFSALALPPIPLGYYETQQAIDMRDNHLPQVNTFIGTPTDLLPYHATAAPTPGQHIVLAWAARLLGYDEVTRFDLPIRFLNALFGYAVLFVAWRLFRIRSNDPWRAAALTLPLACSSYVIYASIWIATDNGALLFYELAVTTAVLNAQLPFSSILIGAGLVMWRQMYLPAAGSFGLVFLFKQRSLRNFLIAGAAALLPCAIMLAYFLQWQGLTPPTFQHFNGFGYGVAGPLSALAFLGLTAPFFAGYLRTGIAAAWRAQRGIVALAAAAVTVLWLAGPTSHDKPAGRWGGIAWTLADHLPSPGDRSPVILLLALLGTFAVVALVAQARAAREVPIELLALALYLVGYSMQIESFQRYIEAPMFFTLGLACCRELAPWRGAWLGPVALATAFGIMSTLRAYNFIGQLFV